MCKLLLELGANRTVEDSRGRTPLDLAREMGLWEVGRLLLDEKGELVEVDEREEERRWEEAVEGMEAQNEEDEIDDDGEWGVDDRPAPAEQMHFEEGLFQWDARPKKARVVR